MLTTIAKAVPKRVKFSEKALLCVLWNYESIIHFEVLPNREFINADVYCAQLERGFIQEIPFNDQPKTNIFAARQCQATYGQKD